MERSDNSIQVCERLPWRGKESDVLHTHWRKQRQLCAWTLLKDKVYAFENTSSRKNSWSFAADYEFITEGFWQSAKKKCAVAVQPQKGRLSHAGAFMLWPVRDFSSTQGISASHEHELTNYSLAGGQGKHCLVPLLSFLCNSFNPSNELHCLYLLFGLSAWKWATPGWCAVQWIGEKYHLEVQMKLTVTIM